MVFTRCRYQRTKAETMIHGMTVSSTVVNKKATREPSFAEKQTGHARTETGHRPATNRIVHIGIRFLETIILACQRIQLR